MAGRGPECAFCDPPADKHQRQIMKGMTFTRLAMAGAALLFAVAATAPSGAAPVGPAATQSFAGQSGSTALDVRYYGRYYGRGHYRGYRHGGFGFFFAPIIVLIGENHDYYDRPYGYGYGGTSCYRICRDYHGPDYCRYYWRRYC